MADAIGIASKMGIKDVASWATARSAPDILIPFDTESLTQGYTRIQDESLVGSAGRARSDQGVQAITGQTVHRLDYNNYDELLSMVFGTLTGRVLTLSEDEVQKYCWIEFEKETSRWRFGACKATKIVISGEKDGLVMATIDWIARDLDRNAGAFASISTVGARNHIRFEDLQYRIDTVAGGPPAAGDTARIEKFEIELDRVLVPDDYASKSQTAVEEKWPLEPVPNGFRVVSHKLTVPRYNTDADWIAWKEADTPIQATMIFTRSAETLTLELPDMLITEGFDASIGGPERLQMEGTLDVYKPDSTNPLYTGNELRATFT
jgi:hypothetical protein